MTNSFAPLPTASSATISLRSLEKEPPVYKIFLLGFITVFALILLGEEHHIIARGFSLFVPGLMILISPPRKGLGRMGDFAAVAFVASLLFAFLPQPYWPSASWKLEAGEALGIDIPNVLSVQPWLSFEAWLMALAGFAWFYVAIQVQVNYSGRKLLFFYLSLILSVMAAIVIWGEYVEARNLMPESANGASFASDQSQIGNFLVLGGVATFAYSMGSLRKLTVLHLIGFPCTMLCLAGLLVGNYQGGLAFYCIGIFLCFFRSFQFHSLPRFVKICLPVLLLIGGFLAVSNERTMSLVEGFFSSNIEVSDELRLKTYRDTGGMILDAPLTGSGLGTFSAVFPQYQTESATYQPVLYPKSDFLWLAAEGGILAIVLFFVFLIAYLAKCRGSGANRTGAYRHIALIVVLIFLVQSLIDVPGHRPETAYFAILFAALALPSAKFEASRLGLLSWRIIGGVLLIFGLAWMASGIFRLPLHSSVLVEKYQSANKELIAEGHYDQATKNISRWLNLKPMDWLAYSQRAKITLARDENLLAAEADFERARFVEPAMGRVSYEEGIAWLDVDVSRAISAWRNALSRHLPSAYDTFVDMVQLVSDSPEKMKEMSRLSEIDPYFRSYILSYLQGDDLLREMNIELSKDPSLAQYTINQRTRIVTNWTKHGGGRYVEDFLKINSATIEKAWWLESMLLKEQADFRGAVDVIRSHIVAPSFASLELDERSYIQLSREYAAAPKDISKSSALFYAHMQREDYPNALKIMDRILELHKLPEDLLYWRAECLQQQKDYIESWYAFEAYLEELWAN